MQVVRQVISLLLFLAIFLAAAASAVMPPAPREWYEERLGKAVPVNFNQKVEYSEQIAQDLADAALARPKNTDNILIILVEFPDNPANKVDHPPQVYDDLLFSYATNPTGSMVEYYEEVSYGAFSPIGTVAAWVMAPQNYTYYTDNAYGQGSYPNNSQRLLRDCVDILDPVIDFSQFDNNYDGYAEAIFLIHAGPGAEETRDPWDIWSHAWSYYYMTDDGVSTGRYSTEPEMHMDGSMIDIGVFAHEYGHVLGLPDLYDTDYTSEGIGVYCLMAGGSWGALPGNPERPTHMSAEMKRRLGWMTTVPVNNDVEDLYIPPSETDPFCYKVMHFSSIWEYFLIENRAKIGFDSLFRGDGGIAIWHIDEYGNQNDETHRYVSLEQADGCGDLERVHGDGNRHPRTNRGDAGDLYPGATHNSKFSFASNPNSKNYSGVYDYMTITFSERNDSIFANIYLDWATADIVFSITEVNVLDTVLSQAASDQDGDADFGEVVDLVLTLACEGGDAASPTGNISTTDTRVNIIDGSAAFNAVNHGNSTSNQNSPFRFEVLSTNVDSAVTFNLHLEDGGRTQDIDLRVNINHQNLLLVLDNNGSHWSDNLVEALHESGHSFDIFSTATDGLPVPGMLSEYKAVVWTTASYFGTAVDYEDYEYCLSAIEIAVLQSYLDANGRLGLFSQDYLYDKGLDVFAQNYLHVASMTEDQGSSAVSGEGGSIFEGFTGTLSEWSFYDYTDNVTPQGDARVILNDISKGGPVAITYPQTRPTADNYAATFSAFAIERLGQASLVDFVSAWADMMISHCGDPNGDGNVNIGDAVYLVNVVFHYGDLPSPYANGDVNCDGAINVGDAVYLANFIFVEEAPAPCAACQ